MTPAAARDSHPVPWHGPMGWDDRLRMHSGRAEDIRKGQLALPPGVTLLDTVGAAAANRDVGLLSTGPVRFSINCWLVWRDSPFCKPARSYT